MRSDEWLKERLDILWTNHFADVPKPNRVLILFKRKWKNKFGHIQQLPSKNTWIAVNKLFKDERVPEYIVNLTIAHEIVHYAHGFQSPLKKKYKHPHRGGVVEKELKERGFGEDLMKEKEWSKKDWLEIYKSYSPKKEANFFNFFLNR